MEKFTAYLKKNDQMNTGLIRESYLGDALKSVNASFSSHELNNLKSPLKLNKAREFSLKLLLELLFGAKEADRLISSNLDAK